MKSKHKTARQRGYEYDQQRKLCKSSLYFTCNSSFEKGKRKEENRDYNSYYTSLSSNVGGNTTKNTLYSYPNLRRGNSMMKMIKYLDSEADIAEDLFESQFMKTVNQTYN